MMDNPLASLVGVHKDVSLGPEALGSSALPGWMQPAATDASISGGLGAVLGAEAEAEIDMAGVLWKRVASDGGASRAAGLPSRQSVLGLLKKRASTAGVEMAITNPWQPRYFELSGGVLSYWRERQDRAQGSAPAMEIALGGYEILIDAKDPFWGFELRPTVDAGRRTWHFRAATEEARLEWAKRMAAQTFVASGAHSVRRASRQHILMSDEL